MQNSANLRRGPGARERFLCRVHFCVGLGTPFRNEERVVAEAFGARSALGDVPLDDPFEEVLLAVEDQRDDRAEAGPAGADALQVAEQEFVVGGEVVTVGGIAGRVYARRTAQCFDFESRIVGEAVAARAVMNVAGFLRSVSRDGVLLFGNLLGDAD